MQWVVGGVAQGLRRRPVAVTSEEGFAQATRLRMEIRFDAVLRRRGAA